MKTQLQLKNLSNGTENFIKRKEKKGTFDSFWTEMRAPLFAN